jgi:lysophospholipase L1-like esterase
LWSGRIISGLPGVFKGMANWGGVSRRVVLTGAVAVIAVGTPLFWEEANSGLSARRPEPVPTPPVSPPVPDWKKLGRLISSRQQIERVVRTDGVFMFGDSLGVGGGPALAQRLAARTHDALAMHNWSGQPTAPAADALAAWARTYGLPRRILMATGSNDIFNPPVVTAQIDRVMSIVGKTRTVVWVNVWVARRKTAATDRLNSARVNRQLTAATHRYPNLQLVHWAEFLDADPARPRRYLRDGVHTTPLGQSARNELIVRALVAASVS